jgi:hypothetical protein
VGVYTDAEVDALLANLPAGVGEPAITVHAGSPPVPLSGDPTPQELEDSFAALSNGLHYYPDGGALIAVLRGEYQTTITITGAVKSVAQIVKSSAGLPTPDNPSMVVTQMADGKWFRVKGDRRDQPFGDPEIVDIFKLVSGGDLTALNAYYTGLEVEALLAPIKNDIAALASNQGQQPQPVDLDLINSQLQSLATITQDVMDKVDAKADKTTVATLSTTLMNSIMEVKDDVYTKSEVDDKLEADKDFSIANDNVLLGQITSLQEIVSNLGTDIGTGQIDVLDAIRDVEIEPSMVSLTGDANSPIAWKGGLSLTPVKEGDHWRLNWNDGKAIHTLVHGDEFTSANIVAALASQDVSVANLQTGGLELNELFMGAAGDRLITQVAGGSENTVAYLSDLSGYAPISTTTLITTQIQALFDSIYTRAESDDRYAAKSDNSQNLFAKTIVAQAVGFGDSALTPAALTYTDTGEGFGPRLVFAVGMVNDYVALRSDFEPIKSRIDALESKAEPASVDAYTKAQVDAKLAAINPTSAANINDPALAAFKKSVLDEVKLMLVGGTKMPPADIDWTPIIRMEGAKETASTQIEARMLGGFIELKGTLTFNAGSGDWVPLRLPPQFPMAEIEAKYPLAMRLVGSAVTYGYCTVSNKNRDIYVSPGARSSEATFSGIRWKAAY